MDKLGVGKIEFGIDKSKFDAFNEKLANSFAELHPSVKLPDELIKVLEKLQADLDEIKKELADIRAELKNVRCE